MFLKSLTLKGFKSFADSTTLNLEPGVTVVVGPNGSGKSNVVDAVAWVLGAQAPSAMRSQKMDDVIFSGTATRPALGRAEVSLVLDNSSGLLPIEFSEVTVSRTLFRSGDSEYAINGVACRLLDVQELLSDAGVGRQQHVIVSQGQIDAVLNSRPEERRAILEEAAGVLKFRKRKEKAERRLDSTEASLLRVQDLLREVRRQLRPLERQADAARRHGDLIAELNALKIFVAGREIAALRARITALASETTSRQAQEQALRAELATLDTGVLAAEGELTARGDADLSDEVVRVEQLRERARGIAAVLVERRRSMERDRGQLMDSGVVANLEADAQELRDELVAVETELGGLGAEEAQRNEEELAFAALREETLASIDGLGASTSAASAAAEVRGELRSMRASLERAEADLRRQRTRLETLQLRAVRIDGESDRLRVECEAAQATEAALVEDVAAAEAWRLAADAAYEAAVAGRLDAAHEASRWKARAEALHLALEGARARAGATHLANVDGVLGTLLDLVEIDDGWEASVEAALGEALEAVVVATPDAGRRALRSLQSNNVHGAVLAVGRHGHGVRASTVDLAEVAGAEPVRPHIRSRHAGVNELLDAVLRGAVCVDRWEDALDLVIDHPAASVVTAAGDRFGPNGWRIGSAGSGATAAALQEAIERSEAADAELARRDAALSAAKADLDAARHQENELTRRLDAHDAGFSANREALARSQAESREVQAEIDTVSRGLVDADDRADRERHRIEELEELIPALEADEAAEAQAAKARGEARAQLEAQGALLAGKRHDLEVRSASLHERQGFLRRRLDETERRLAADVAARASAAERRLAVDRSMHAVERLAALVDGHRRVIEVRHNELLEIRRRQSDEVRAASERLEGLRRRRAQAESELEATRERSRRLEIEETEIKVRLEGALQSLRAEHDIEPDVAEAAELPALPEGANPAGRVRDLERELRLMGPINPLALEEFNVLKERHQFLETQLEDVRTTRRDLMRVVKAVDLEIQTVFSAAFADVSAHFTTLFATLFPGGVGKLTLTSPDDLLNTGVDVEAKPGGKNVKKLSLLSGGERSLTALAFLFAVFRSRPSPFYVMDEVEAALDDVNLHRFLSLVDEFRREAQLLIVSHQKRTMEAGDCLIGVSMQPGGSSKVVVERVSSSA